MSLTEADREAIADAISKAERTTSGEIVFSLADSCGEYRHASILGSLISTFLITFIYLLLPTSHTVSVLIWLQTVSLVLFYPVWRSLPLRRWLISSTELDLRTWHSAFIQFYSSGLYRTREHNGVLIHLCCFEKRAVVLGDKAVHEKVGNSKWDEVTDLIITGIRERNPRDGICRAIAACAEVLAGHFPARPDDRNELSNQVLPPLD